MHGGSVRAASDGPGHGSEFTVRLPVVVQPAAGDAGDTPHLQPRPTLRKVLVVDDNVDAARTLDTLLTLHGITVSIAYDGAAAVELVKREVHDAVVMDIGMPVMNGYEAARRIRQDPTVHQPMLIALTGWGQYQDKARAAEAGFDHHLVKPLEIEQLLMCLSGAAGAGGSAGRGSPA
jgi:CheY-like chemotaxis protein